MYNGSHNVDLIRRNVDRRKMEIIDLTARGVMTATKDAFILYLVAGCTSPRFKASLLLNAHVCVMTLAPNCVYNVNNEALHSCTAAVHGVCHVFGVVRLQ